MTTTDVLVVDDDELVRRGLCDWLATLPDIRVVGDVGDAEQCLASLKQLRPQVAIVDIQLPGISGINLVKEIAEQHADVKCLMLSGSMAPDLILDAFAAGASGFLGKLTSARELHNALLQVRANQWYLAPAVTEQVLRKAMTLRAAHQAGEGAGDLVELTDRERELLLYIAEGRSFTEIAQKLSISSRSVERLKGKLEEKLRATTLADLVKAAIRQGLISA